MVLIKFFFQQSYKQVIMLCFVLFFSNIVSRAQVSDFKDIDFTQADIQARLYPDYPIDNLKSLSDQLTASLHTDVEKFRAIYLWVSLNIDNDFDYYILNKRKREKWIHHPEKLREWDRQFSVKVFEKLVKERKTVCTGYAYLINELAYHAGIKSEIVNGYGRTIQGNIGGEGIPNHSWNAVQLNDKWYLCDATWSSGSVIAEIGYFVKDFSEGYFLADPSIFVKSHYPLDTTWMFLDKKPSLHQFLNGPLIYKGAFDYHITPISPEKFEVPVKKGEQVVFRFQMENEVNSEKIKLDIARSNTVIDSVVPQVYKDSDGFYCINYTFNSKGLLAVHLLVDGKYIMSYEVKVGKPR